VVGLLIFSSLNVPITYLDLHRDLFGSHSDVDVPEFLEDSEEATKNFVNVERLRVSRNNQILGLKITIFGTVIWAYGWVIEYIPCFVRS